VNLDPNDIKGIYTQVQARLILNNPAGFDDRSSARYLVNDGADYWRSVSAPWAADWSNNDGVASGRFKFVKNDWQNFTMTTLLATEFSQNPPPV
jgi:hemolysin activation/secretion protein